ncbi:MAG: polysaccharide deacetylase family protein [Saprospiraceae bacterium]|nr:polysaccharide deacetylase family protein [Saprospiraceae bacterium]
MLTISVPGHFLPESTYVLDVLLRQNLGLSDFHLKPEAQTNFIFEGPGGSFEFENVFFSRNTENPYTKEQLPSKPTTLDYGNLQITALYGHGEIHNENGRTRFGIDIVGSTFFLLTQWESTLIEGDYLSRFDYHKSTLYKFDLYGQPLVNQYVALLQLLLAEVNIAAKTKAYAPVFTCDVDSIMKYKSWRNLAGAVYHSRKSRSGLGTILKSYINAKRDIKKDPYYSFAYIMQILAGTNLPRVFYFMAGKSDEKYDCNDYAPSDPLIREVIDYIKSNQGQIGLHPSIESWKSVDVMQKEKMTLENDLGHVVTRVRQHYLRYDVRTTWQQMEACGFMEDSSMQFTQGCGFAAGSCTPFNLYDLTHRRMTSVTEVPLLVMKKKDYGQFTDAQYESFSKVIDMAKKYQGRFMVLFHNSDLETTGERKLFEGIIQQLS